MTTLMSPWSPAAVSALDVLGEQPFDCVVLDLRLPDMSGFEVLERLRETPSLGEVPVVVFTGKELSPEEDARLRHPGSQRGGQRSRVAGTAAGRNGFFLHRVITNLPTEKQNMLDRLHRSDEALIGKKVLVVDDDVRNIFALSSVLERRGMTVLDRRYRPRSDCDP